MARYSQFLGRRVEVQYRAGDIVLPASGLFVADSGRSIFLEQNLEQRVPKHFRWEIPYQCLVKIEEVPGAAEGSPRKASSQSASASETGKPRSEASAAAAAGSLLSLHKPKTA